MSNSTNDEINKLSEIQEINIKPCKICGSTTNSFQPNRRKCTKCRSKINNAQRKSYYKEYYETNKDQLLMRSKINYLKKKNYIESLEEFTPYENST